MLYSCINLTSIDIPESVREIGESVLTNTKIRHLHIPKSVVKVSNKAFKFCRELKDIKFDDVDNIDFGSGIFCQDNKLTSIFTDREINIYDSSQIINLSSN